MFNQGYIPAKKTVTSFADYNDLATSTTPISLTANTWTDIPNDGAGPYTNLNFYLLELLLC